MVIVVVATWELGGIWLPVGMEEFSGVVKAFYILIGMVVKKSTELHA